MRRSSYDLDDRALSQLPRSGSGRRPASEARRGCGRELSWDAIGQEWHQALHARRCPGSRGDRDVALRFLRPRRVGRPALRHDVYPRAGGPGGGHPVPRRPWVERFGVFGSSMGGAVALLAAARDGRVCAVATLAAVAHPALIVERYQSRPTAGSVWATSRLPKAGSAAACSTTPSSMT